MSRATSWRGGWAGAGQRIAAIPHPMLLAGIGLGLLSVAELIVRLVRGPGWITRIAGGSVSWQFLLLFFLLSLAGTLPLAFLGRVPAALAISAASAVSLAFFQTLTLAGFAVQLIVLYRLGRGGAQWLALLLTGPFVALAVADRAAGRAWIPALLLASLGPAAALAGSARRAQRDAIEHSAAREAIAGTQLEHTARGERARISRELHDVVAHHISMIAVQAETARLTTPGMPAAGAQRLSSIGDTARAALTEMRRLLGVLREDTETGVADRQPQPGLRQLNELLDAAREASGTGARLILHGAPVTLDPGVELAAYRIIQEALTNARRHAPGAAVDVELLYADDRLQLFIRDNGPGTVSPDTGGRGGVRPYEGHGLLGMRERAAAVGGELSTGEAVGGGFLVWASLPGKREAA